MLRSVQVFMGSSLYYYEEVLRTLIRTWVDILMIELSLGMLIQFRHWHQLKYTE
jgi:hypothetical protein